MNAEHPMIHDVRVALPVLEALYGDKFAHDVAEQSPAPGCRHDRKDRRQSPRESNAARGWEGARRVALIIQQSKALL